MNPRSYLEPYKRSLEELLGVYLDFEHESGRFFIGQITHHLRGRQPEFFKVVSWKRRVKAWKYFMLYTMKCLTSGYAPNVLNFMLVQEVESLKNDHNISTGIVFNQSKDSISQGKIVDPAIPNIRYRQTQAQRSGRSGGDLGSRNKDEKPEETK